MFIIYEYQITPKDWSERKSIQTAGLPRRAYKKMDSDELEKKVMIHQMLRDTYADKGKIDLSNFHGNQVTFITQELLNRGIKPPKYTKEAMETYLGFEV